MPQREASPGQAGRVLHRRSLAWHLLIRLLPAVLLLAAMDSVVTFVLTRKLNNHSHDRALIDMTRALAHQVVMTPQGPQLDPSWNTTRFLTMDPEERTYFRISVDGQVIAGRADLGPPPAMPEPDETDEEEADAPASLLDRIGKAVPTIYDAVVEELPVRAVALDFSFEDYAVEVAMGETLNTRNRFVDEVLSVLVAGQLLLIVLLGFVIVAAVRSGLESVSKLSDEIESRSIDDLQPIGGEDVPSELTLLIAKTNSLLARVGQAVAAQRRFIGHAAHQLRTPLSGLKLESELMLARPLPDDVRQRAERIKAATDRMIRLGEQLLVLARIEANVRPRDAFTRLDLTELTRESGAQWVPAARHANVDIVLVAPDDPVWVDGDVVLLEQLLGNLVDNAIRYLGRPGQIVLRVIDSPPSLVVEDDGPGIHAEDRARVFDAFYRAKDSLVGGSGLGLAIVKEIAEAHGAHWDLRSRPEFGGTRISLVFPGPRIGADLSRFRHLRDGAVW
ncbi:Sensor protein QseC [Pigmentiphaga humi]|uniref:histidine kinase n=1 Tax=Pigmentiphaga humi TaxID=2478468 RepID=A0A3P4B328_9BURK|nr:Sensor protein QseC [Pigmentiphaga humi]